MAQQKFTIDINTKYNKEERQAIAQRIIDHIVKRTVEKNVDKNNRPFPKYSKEYTKSPEFRIAGKSKKVNLTLSGDMLAEMRLLSERSGKITIGYEDGTEENSKAEGNVKGTYGQSKPIPGKKRDFLGISNNDLKGEILKDFPLKGTKKKPAEKIREESLEEFRQLNLTTDRITGLLTLEQLEDVEI